ncbi:MAG TPA: hypothetical protein VG267_02355 [Terracidiphilus sp.]|jgi:hypothetical protein|nr:hypothetical protein [Terracidiphilus sp.]
MRLTGFAKIAALAVTVVVSVPAFAQASGAILTRTDTQKLLPPSVYYKGQSAPTQLRNSGGVKFSDGSYVLATLVDNSGYSSDVATKYQGYFIAEVPLKIGGQDLPAGVYGFGFVTGDKFVLTDVGGHDVLSVSSTSDDAMKRPMPLQVTSDPAGGYRLYSGRKYVSLNR